LTRARLTKRVKLTQSIISANVPIKMLHRHNRIVFVTRNYKLRNITFWFPPHKSSR